MRRGVGATLVVVAPGLSTTVQDRGRFGWQRLGVPVSGALDTVGLAAANAAVGNAGGEAAFECLYRGPELAVRGESVRCAVAGAGLDVLDADGVIIRRCGPLESTTVAHGERLRVRMTQASISAYLAIEGGIAVPLVLGSRATYARAGIGGFRGRAIRAGDRVPLGRTAATPRAEMRLTGVPLEPAEVVRVTLGPQDDHFTDEAIEALVAGHFVVLPASDRMGLRLGGPLLTHRAGADIVSDGIPPGAVQVPGDGQPIVMLADRQTTGGYTKIATVISADLPALGRIGAGAEVRFEVVSVETAEALARVLSREIASWPRRLIALPTGGEPLEMLGEANLISGFVDADQGGSAFGHAVLNA